MNERYSVIVIWWKNYRETGREFRTFDRAVAYATEMAELPTCLSAEVYDYGTEGDSCESVFNTAQK